MGKQRTVIEARVKLTLYTNEPLDHESIESAAQRHLAQDSEVWDQGAVHVTGTAVSSVIGYRVVEPRVEIGHYCRYCGVKDPKTYDGACTRCGEPHK